MSQSSPPSYAGIDLIRDLLLEVAGIRCLVRVPTLAWSRALAAHFAPFIATGREDWCVTLTLDEQAPELVVPWLCRNPVFTHFHFAAYHGWLDLNCRDAGVSAPSLARAPAALGQTLALICDQALPQRGDAFLLHAAGIVIDGSGHIFAGPTGSGKTTLATLAAGHGTVLSDAAVIVYGGPRGIEVLSTPCWGLRTPSELVVRVNRRAPLRAIYLLAPGPGFHLERLASETGISALLDAERLAQDDPVRLGWLEVAQRLIPGVPVYRLQFRPIEEIWRFLATTRPREGV